MEPIRLPELTFRQFHWKSFDIQEIAVHVKVSYFGPIYKIITVKFLESRFFCFA